MKYFYFKRDEEFIDDNKSKENDKNKNHSKILFDNDKKGIPTYEALDDRLKTVLNTDLVDMRKPILNLRGFNGDDLKEIGMKLTEMHEQTYMWDASDKIAPILDGIVQTHVRNAELTGGKVTPRTFIRSFISVLDTVQQNQQAFKSSDDILEMFNQEESGKDIDFDDIDEFDDDW